MLKYNNLLQQLIESPRITRSTLNEAPTQQGAYVWWLDVNPPVCLKVEVSGPRRGRGIWERLHLHFLSNDFNSVIARHLKADIDLGGAQGYDFQDRLQRQQFLADKCFFKVLPLPSLSKKQLIRFQGFLESQLNPRYIGRLIFR